LEPGLASPPSFIHPDNTASRKLVEKLRFRCEGLLRNNLRVGREWRDDTLYALLASDRHSQP
jgi:ribosomal-protein-alanine N-acetyltransferase